MVGGHPCGVVSFAIMCLKIKVVLMGWMYFKTTTILKINIICLLKFLK